MNILEVMDDPELFGRWFAGPSWMAWRAFLRALFGLPTSDTDLAIFSECTGRASVRSYSEAWLVCGRRAGKSFVLALVAVYLATFRSYREHLAPGERATILVIATDRRQARVIFRYIKGLITGTPMLKAFLQGEPRADNLDLYNGVTIEVGTASYRTSRGYSFAAVLADEIAFWPTDSSAEPDYEILDAVRPGLATIPGAMLLCASSPYARRGALWDAFQRYYGQDGTDVLVWRAPTRTMNPTVPQGIIERAVERDVASAASEYYAEFRNDVDAFLTLEAIQAVVPIGVRERAPINRFRYAAFCDPSGGSRDSMTLAVSHIQDKRVVIDCVREVRAPFRPDDAVRDFVETLKRYGVKTIIGDRYAGEWPRDAFARYGIRYKASEKVKSDIYREVLPLINSCECELVDDPRLIAQFASLERRTSRGGRDSIDHPPHGHDDLANAVAGALITGKRNEEGRYGTFLLRGYV
jgi:hypothetical protein